MTKDQAMGKLKTLQTYPANPDEDSVVGRAVAVLLMAGCHDIRFTLNDDGSLTLNTGPIEMTDPRETAGKGELQRSTSLLVYAACEAQRLEYGQ